MLRKDGEEGGGFEGVDYICPKECTALRGLVVGALRVGVRRRTVIVSLTRHNSNTYAHSGALGQMLRRALARPLRP